MPPPFLPLSPPCQRHAIITPRQRQRARRQRETLCAIIIGVAASADKNARHGARAPRRAPLFFFLFHFHDHIIPCHYICHFGPFSCFHLFCFEIALFLFCFCSPVVLFLFSACVISLRVAFLTTFHHHSSSQPPSLILTVSLLHFYHLERREYRQGETGDRPHRDCHRERQCVKEEA